MRKALDTAAVFALSLMFWITWRAFHSTVPLSARVPIHFNAAGQADGWGSPISLLLLPSVAGAVCGLMWVVARMPQSFNFPVRVTPANRRHLEGLAVEMIAWLRAEMAWMFAWIQWSAVEAVRDPHRATAERFMPVWIAVIFVTIGWHIVAMVRAGAPRPR